MSIFIITGMRQLCLTRMASTGESETEELDELLTSFVKAMDLTNSELVDKLLRIKLMDPSVPLDVGHCALLAAKRGNADVLAKVLMLNPRMNFSDADGRRAIHYASRNGSLNCVKLLLNAGAFSNCWDQFGRTPLHLACANGHADIVQLLISSGAHINSCRTGSGENALHITAAYGHIEVMKLLLENYGDIDSVNTHMREGKTPLHKAIAAEKTEMVEYLCSQKANVNILDSNSKSPLHVACEKGLLHCVTTLLRYGASLEVTDSQNQTPLCAAIVENQTNAAKLLIDQGADLHFVDKYGYSPLHTAAMRGNVEVIDYLVTAGADVNMRTSNNLQSPLMTAVSLGQMASIHTLIALGADTTLPDNMGRTALHLVFARLGGAPVDEITKALLEGGGRLDVRDSGHLNPLQRGIIIGVVRRAKLLPWLQLMSQAGAVLQPDQFTLGKNSPLFILAYSGFLQEALYLVQAGWDLNLETWVALPGKDDKQNQLHQFMIKSFKTVPSLLLCCRKTLRLHMSLVREYREILTTIDSLPIPTSLKAFLKLYDIDAEDTSVLDLVSDR